MSCRGLFLKIFTFNSSLLSHVKYKYFLITPHKPQMLPALLQVVYFFTLSQHSHFVMSSQIMQIKSNAKSVEVTYTTSIISTLRSNPITLIRWMEQAGHVAYTVVRKCGRKILPENLGPDGRIMFQRTRVGRK